MIPTSKPEPKQKQFDCIAMKRRIQERIAQETEGMTPEELIAYFHDRVARSQFAHWFDRVPGVRPDPE